MWCLAQIVVLGLAGAGKFTLWGAVLVDVGTALVVIFNGLTVLRWSRFPPGQRSEARPCAAELCALEVGGGAGGKGGAGTVHGCGCAHGDSHRNVSGVSGRGHGHSHDHGQLNCSIAALPRRS